MKFSVVKRILSIGALILAGNGFAANQAATEMAAAANNFLASLDAKQKAKATYDLKAEDRFRWNFLPTEMVKGGRTGLSMTEMKKEQKALARKLVQAGMSKSGFRKTSQIMMLEGLLREIEKKAGKSKLDRNPILYFVSIFGKPSADGTWAWRFEGHHFSQAFTIIEGKAFVSTPSFMGSNPGEVQEGKHKGLRVLGKEEDLARKLVNSLDDSQKQIAVYSEKPPRDILSSANRKAEPLKPAGLGYGKLKKGQKGNLQAIVREYVNRVRPELAKADLEEIKKGGWNKVTFAWAGSLKKGEGHYYRIQGPSFLLEYANTQNKAAHVHATWREFKGDYGSDLLAKHFAKSHK
jgi:hypothetical protein